MKAFEMLYIGNNFNFIVGQFTLKCNDKNNRVNWIIMNVQFSTNLVYLR